MGYLYFFSYCPHLSTWFAFSSLLIQHVASSSASSTVSSSVSSTTSSSASSTASSSRKLRLQLKYAQLIQQSTSGCWHLHRVCPQIEQIQATISVSVMHRLGSFPANI